MPGSRNAPVFLAAGFFLVLTALFADQVGLGLGSGWSKSRTAILVLGLLMGLVPFIRWRTSSLYRAGASPAPTLLLTFPLLIVLLVYAWFIRLSYNTTSNYYDLLASSFQQGQLSLSLRPDPALLALPNPYDPAARRGLNAPLDLSLYQGKYYLYWGAGPALLVVLVKPLVSAEISDGYLLFAFLYGTFLVEFLLIVHLWERFFPATPKWMILLSILVAGLVTPSLWLLSRPKIYETAIAGGQFFFLAGLFFTVTALDRPAPSKARLLLAGLCWSLAVGTRSVLLFPIAFLTLMVIARFYELHRGSLLPFVRSLLPLAVPLLIGAIVFAWYNWARFGSFSETGFRYALAGPDLQKHLHELFLPAYAFQNLYNYLINPFALRTSFPFVFPLRGMTQGLLPWPVLPEFYSAQAVTGSLCSAPFVVLAVRPVVRLVKELFRRNRSGQTGEEPEGLSLSWIMTGLFGSFLTAFLCLLFFFWAAMRYAQDFMPALTLLAVIAFWQGHQISSLNSNKGKMYTGLGLVLAGVSIVIGILLALSIYFSNGLL